MLSRSTCNKEASFSSDSQSPLDVNFDGNSNALPALLDAGSQLEALTIGHSGIDSKGITAKGKSLTDLTLKHAKIDDVNVD